MIKYRVERIDNTVVIIENATEQKVLSFLPSEANKAHRIAKKWNRSDGSFNGWTPSFMLRKLDGKHLPPEMA